MGRAHRSSPVEGFVFWQRYFCRTSAGEKTGSQKCLPWPPLLRPASVDSQLLFLDLLGSQEKRHHASRVQHVPMCPRIQDVDHASTDAAPHKSRLGRLPGPVERVLPHTNPTHQLEVSEFRVPWRGLRLPCPPVQDCDGALRLHSSVLPAVEVFSALWHFSTYVHRRLADPGFFVFPNCPESASSPDSDPCPGLGCQSELVPTQNMTFVGVQYQLDLGLMFPPQERYLRICQKAHHAMTTPSIRLQKWQSLIGRSRACVDHVTLGRLHSHPLYILLHSLTPVGAYADTLISLSPRARPLLSWWMKRSNIMRGVSIVPRAYNTLLTTDSSIGAAMWRGLCGSH